MIKKTPTHYRSFLEQAIEACKKEKEEDQKDTPDSSTKGGFDDDFLVWADMSEEDIELLHPGYSPVDSSEGRIRHILLSLYAGHDPVMRNAYNKLFTDLIIKLLHANRYDVDKPLIVSVIVQNDQQRPGEMEPKKYLRSVLDAVLLLAQIGANQEQQKMPVIFKIVPITMDGLDHWIQDPFLMLQNRDNLLSTRIIEKGDHFWEIDLGQRQEAQDKIKEIKTNVKEIRTKLKEEEDEVEQTKLRAEEDKLLDELRELQDDKTGARNSENTPSVMSAPFTEGAENKLPIDMAKTDLDLTGGNILFVGEYAFVGYDNVGKSGWRGEDEIFKKKFKALTGVALNKIILIKNSIGEMPEVEPKDIHLAHWAGKEQPIYHLDLFMNAAGIDEFGRYRLMIGELVFDDYLHLPIFEWTKKNVEAIVAQIQVACPDLAIYRNPLPLTYVDYFPTPKEVEESSEPLKLQKNRLWFLVSYNNCIIQYTKEEENRMVWLPKYGKDYSDEKSSHSYKGEEVMGFAGNWSNLKVYDDANRRIFKSLGFKVIKLTNYLPLAFLRGSVHCMTKVLFRDKN